MTFTYGELFAGIGGMSLGLDRAGMSPRWFVEIDPFCRQVLAKHWPDVPQYGDIKELTGDELEPVDLIAGGFPCPPVSAAGRRLGSVDSRWLWPEFARMLRHLRPRYVLVENVAGLLSLGFGEVLGDLAALGFDAEWAVHSACAAGAPHMRRRVFIVAHPAGVGRDEGEVLGGPAGSPVDPQPETGERRWGDSQRAGQDWLAPDPQLHRMADGFPTGLDVARLRALGNAVVPQVAEWVGRRILAADRAGAAA